MATKNLLSGLRSFGVGGYVPGREENNDPLVINSQMDMENGGFKPTPKGQPKDVMFPLYKKDFLGIPEKIKAGSEDDTLMAGSELPSLEQQAKLKGEEGATFGDKGIVQEAALSHPDVQKILGSDNNSGAEESKQDKAVASTDETKNAAEEAQSRALVKSGRPDAGVPKSDAIEMPGLDLEPAPFVLKDDGNDGSTINMGPPPNPEQVPSVDVKPPEEKTDVKMPNSDLSYFRRIFQDRMKDAEDASFRVVGGSTSGAPGAAPGGAAALLGPTGSAAGATTQTGGGNTPPPGTGNSTAAGAGNTGGGSKKKKEPSQNWVLSRIAGKLIESGGKDFGNISRGLGKILGSGARAIGNIGAALDTAGAQQQAVWGGAQYGQFGRGVGEAIGTGAEVLGDILGSGVEGLTGTVGSVAEDYSSHQELAALQQQMFEKMRKFIKQLKSEGIDVDRAGTFDVLKNIANTYGINTLSNAKMRKP